MPMYESQLSTDEALARTWDAYPDQADADHARATLDADEDGATLRPTPAPGSALPPIDPAADPPETQPLAVSAIDGEWIGRETRIATLERQAVSARDDYVRSAVDLGRILLEHRQLCAENDTRVGALIERIGLTRSNAYALIRVAGAVAQFPKLRDLADRQFSHVLALLHGTTEEQLEQIASGALPDLTLDDVDKLSVRELKKRVKALTEDSDKRVTRETKVLLKERDELVKARDEIQADRDRLAALVKDDLAGVRDTMAGNAKLVSDLTGGLTAAYRQLDALGVEECLTPQGQILLDEIEGLVERVSLAGSQLWQYWIERRDQDWGGAR
jgi:hypothetical protein